MSDRFCGIYVTLDQEIQQEHLDHIKELIMSIKGVKHVTEKVSDANHYFAYNQARIDLTMKLYRCLE